MEIRTPAWFYAQHGANYSLPHPGQGYGGWTKTDIPIDPAHTAIVCMHCWYVPPREEYPGIYKLCEYIPRSQQIMDELMPSFLEKTRASGIRIIHVGSQIEISLPDLPGYQRVCEKYPVDKRPYKTIPHDETAKKLFQFRSENIIYDKETADSANAAQALRDFYIKPQDNEDVVCTTNQLFGLCQEYGISHLIYTGFCVNACLMISPCGYVDMTRHGILCSIVRDLTTAVENKESCATEGNKEYGLWAYSMWGGFVFDSEDLKNTLLK